MMKVLLFTTSKKEAKWLEVSGDSAFIEKFPVLREHVPGGRSTAFYRYDFIELATPRRKEVATSLKGDWNTPIKEGMKFSTEKGHEIQVLSVGKPFALDAFADAKANLMIKGNIHCSQDEKKVAVAVLAMNRFAKYGINNTATPNFP